MVGNKKAYTFKPSKDESLEILKFLENQSNVNDTIRYLIEKEIFENGNRNLQMFIPPIRSDEYFKAIVISNKSTGLNISNTVQTTKDSITSKPEEKIQDTTIEKQVEIEVATDLKDNEPTNIENIKEQEKEDEEIPDCYA